jgi:hypothetical protein
MKLTAKLFIVTGALLLETTGVQAVDLLARYPTQLVKGDAEPDHARAWEFSPADIFQVAQFTMAVGDKFKVETGAADLGIGHCADGAVWAVLIPRATGTLTSSAADKTEPIASVWLRFHPAQLNRLFAPDTVSADGNRELAAQIRAIAGRKMITSWQSNEKAMIPEPKDLTVFVDTKEEAHRFFVVDTEAKTARYVDAFNRQSSRQISATSVPPVVVKTWPEAGSQKVSPGVAELKVTFSHVMRDESWSWSTAWENSTPESVEKPRYESNHKTCVWKVKLEPGKTYGFWLNSERFKGFRDTNDLPAVPYLLVFSTKGSPSQADAGQSFLAEQIQLANAGNYWAKFQLWQGFSQGEVPVFDLDGHRIGKNEVTKDSAAADKWLSELVKGAYLATFEPVNGFNPRTPGEMLDRFSEQCRLFSGKASLGGASLFRTTRHDGKLIGSFLTETPDAFKAAVEKSSAFKLISMEKVTPEMFLAHEASAQESL